MVAPTTVPEVPIAFISVRVDKGEGAEYMEQALMRMAAQHPDQIYMDVICTPGSVRKGSRLIERFYDIIGEHYPLLALDHVFVGITCEQNLRPAGSLLMQINQIIGQEVKLQDINPGREDNWPKK